MLELRAIRDIGPGEEICVDYIGDRSYLMARHQRRSLLRDTWGFDIGEELAEKEEEDVERRVLELLDKIRTRLREKMMREANSEYNERLRGAAWARTFD